MKLFDFYTIWDYGRDIYLTIGQFKNFHILDTQFHSSCYWDWEPNIDLSLGIFNGSAFSFGIRIFSLSLSMSFISYRGPMNLSHIREL